MQSGLEHCRIREIRGKLFRFAYRRILLNTLLNAGVVFSIQIYESQTLVVHKKEWGLNQYLFYIVSLRNIK